MKKSPKFLEIKPFSMSTKKENPDIESSRSTHRGASFISSFNSNVIKKVFGSADEQIHLMDEEKTLTRSPSFTSKLTAGNPMMMVSFTSSLREQVEMVNEKRQLESSTKISSFQAKLTAL